MDLGLEPPLTGKFVLNPWADFNISGQFLCETFGLVAPGMPQTASRIGLNYTRVAIDLEPAQTTQLFTSMIAMAFVSEDVDQLLDAGVSALDPQSQLREIIGNVRRWHAEFPDDWRATRRRVKEEYSRHGGQMRDRNGFELNTAATIAALLYGKGDFTKSLTTAFNFGWDCDNTAATAGTIIGATKGYRWILSQDWQIVDRYRNTTRDNMPQDETITSFADRLIDLAEQVIVQHGGERRRVNGTIVYRIVREKPQSVARLARPEELSRQMRTGMATDIQRGLGPGATTEELARATYLAICLDLVDTLREADPGRWEEGLRALRTYKNVVQAIYFYAPFPAGDRLRAKAAAAGLQKPDKKRDLW
jgi:hypothetical protein